MITEEDIKNINMKLNRITNIAIILDTLYKPIQELKEERKYPTVDDTIKVKENADKYLKHYASTTLRNNIQDIRKILNGEKIYTPITI